MRVVCKRMWGERSVERLSMTKSGEMKMFVGFHCLPCLAWWNRFRLRGLEKVEVGDAVAFIGD